ncbi:MAG: TonB family protein [Robiginitomaculum sp.]|nr:TonB family protein [Robiginitomaculum sp.]
MRIISIVLISLLLTLLVVTDARSHPLNNQGVQYLRTDMRNSISKEDWTGVIEASQILEYYSKTIKPKNLYFVGLAYSHENQPAMAASFFSNFLSISKPTTKNHQSASLQLEQLKSQLPEYCLASSRACTRAATSDFLRNKDKGDLNMAFLLYQLSCDSRNAQACFGLGFMYENGFVVEKNVTLAVSFYTGACDKKYAKACKQLGEMYQFGKLITADLEKAIHYYQLECKYKKAGGCEKLKQLGVSYSHKARPISRRPPIYPMQAARKGTEGSCKMTFDVSNKGRVRNIRATCTDKVFLRNAKASLRKWKYAPKVVDGVAVASTVRTTKIDFKLN